MDETDLKWFKNKKGQNDKADATLTASPTSPSSKAKEEKKEIFSIATSAEDYNCDNPNVGIALIFNHKKVKNQKERVGTEQDRDAMKGCLANYGFDVRVYNELTFEEVSNTLKETAAEDHSQNDCLVVVVMSHGLDGKVYASDMSYPVERLWNPFLGENCKSLINKPKLFFVQACRGEQLEKAVTYSEFAPMSRVMIAVPEEQTYAIPNTADMLVMYSTFEKHYSFRNVENGSWFIQCLCKAFNQAAAAATASTEGTELLRLLTSVNRMVAYEYQSNSKYEELNQMKEMPNFMSTLTKTLYLKVKRGSL